MMQGSVAIVTGGGTGIGAATVRRLAARGVSCVINYASSRDDAEALVELGEFSNVDEAGSVGGGEDRLYEERHRRFSLPSLSY